MAKQVHVKNKQFFFINKSEESTHLSKSLPDEKSAIQRHVQTGRKRSRLSKHGKLAIRAHPTPSTKRSNSVLKLGNAGSKYDNDTTKEAETTKATLWPGRGSSGLYDDDSDFPDEARKFVSSLFPEKLLCKQDPFNATSMPLDKTVTGLLHYYVYYHHPSQWPNEMAVLRHGVYVFHDSVLRTLRTAIADKLAMCCLLSAAACRFQFVDRLPGSLVTGKETIFIHQALQLMSSYMNNIDMRDENQVKQCLFYIMFLTSAESYRGNLSASKVHQDAGVQLLKLKGGISFLKDKYLQAHFAMGDLFLACVNLEPCSLDCFYDPGPAGSLNLLDSEMSAISTLATASSFLDRSDGFVPSQLAVIIQQILETHTVRNRISTFSMQPTRATQVTHWITLRNMAIRNRLLAMEISDPKIHALRVALIMWTLLTMNVTGRVKTVKLMAPKLRSCVSRIEPSTWADCEDVRLWIALVGMHCVNEEDQVSKWFMNECCCLSHRWMLVNQAGNGAREWLQQLETLQRGFLYDESVQRTRTYALAERLRCLSG